MLTRFAPLLLLSGALVLTAWLFWSGEDEASRGAETSATEQQSTPGPGRRTLTQPSRAAAEEAANATREPAPATAGTNAGTDAGTNAAAVRDMPANKRTAAERAAAQAAERADLVRKAHSITAEERKRGADLAEAARGAPAPEARAEVKLGLRDKSAYVRLQALQALTRFKTEGASDIHDHLLVERSEEVQKACVHLLGRHGDASMIDELESWAIGKPRDLVEAVDKARRKLSQRNDLERPERLAPRREHKR